MAIDINKTNISPRNQLRGPEAKKLDTVQQSDTKNLSQSAAASNTAPKDSVSLTQQAQSLNQMQRTMANSPSFNQEKVANIKKAIADGQYKVNPDKLAQKMHSFEEEFGKLAS